MYVQIKKATAALLVRFNVSRDLLLSDFAFLGHYLTYVKCLRRRDLASVQNPGGIWCCKVDVIIIIQQLVGESDALL